MSPRLTLTLIARIPADGVEAFRAYEDAVIPLMSRYGGALERRLRTADGLVEIHLVSFPDAAAFGAFRSDPERAARSHLLEQSGAVQELFEVTEVARD